MTSADHPGRRALDHVDRALADRPEKNSHELSAALRCLAEFRDALIATRRTQPDRASDPVLEPVNAVISSVLAAQFPLGEIPWEELEKARGWLADAVNGSRAIGTEGENMAV